MLSIMSSNVCKNVILKLTNFKTISFKTKKIQMKIIINGKTKQFNKDVLTFKFLIEELDLVNKRFAIEKNGEIIPKSKFTEHTLKEGDKLEIIGAVGGG